jgi:hypothetical protein
MRSSWRRRSASVTAPSVPRGATADPEPWPRRGHRPYRSWLPGWPVRIGRESWLTWPLAWRRTPVGPTRRAASRQPAANAPGRRCGRAVQAQHGGSQARPVPNRPGVPAWPSSSWPGTLSPVPSPARQGAARAAAKWETATARVWVGAINPDAGDDARSRSFSNSQLKNIFDFRRAFFYFEFRRRARSFRFCETLGAIHPAEADPDGLAALLVASSR